MSSYPSCSTSTQSQSPPYIELLYFEYHLEPVVVRLKSLCPLLYPFRDEYMQYFEQRDLKVFSVEPLLLFPTHYTGEPGYFRDMETSTIWDDEAVDTDWDRDAARRRSKQETNDAGSRPVNLSTLISEGLTG